MSGLRPVQNNSNTYIPQVQAAGPAPSTGGLSDLYNFDVFDMIRRKVWLILFFTLLGIALSLLFFFKAPKTYRSTAKVFVDEKSAPSLNDDGFNQNTVEKYIEVLRSTATLKHAIRDGKFERMEIFEDVDSVIRYLRDGKALIAKSADVKSNSGVIKISFDGQNQEETQEVLKAVVGAFGKYIDSDAKDIGGQTTELWTTLHQNMLGRTVEVQAEIEKLMSLPEMLIVDGRVQNPYQLQQARLHEEMHQLRRERTRLEARVSAIQQAKALGKNPESLVIGVLQEFNDTSRSAYASTHDKYVELKVQEQELTRKFGAQHPEVKNVREQVAMLETMRMEELSSLRGKDDGLSRGKSDMVGDFVERMAGQISMISAQESSLAESIKEEQRKAAETSVNIERLLALQRERDRLELYSDNTIDKLGEVRVLEDFQWRSMSVLNPASIAEQVAPSLPLCLGGGLFLGTLFGFLFAGVKELAEKTFRSSDDIAALLGSRVIGHVGLFQRVRPRKDSPFANVAPELITLHQPSNQNCEAYRSIRTSIFFRAQETGAKIIQITSPTPGDGKSTTISNIAASMAQSGRKVLVIDADLRKPRQHKYFGVDNDYGLTSVVYGQMEPEEAVRVIQAEYLSVVTCGPIPPNPSELLTSARFEAIIGVYREQYDYILIDTPPLLAVTDPAIVCRFVDLIYMVMRINNGVRSNSVRAKEVVDSMGVELSGVIINGLRRRDQKTYDYKGGKYGYGGYTYGAGYGSSYGKNYSGTASAPASAAPSAMQPPVPNLLDTKSTRSRTNS